MKKILGRLTSRDTSSHSAKNKEKRPMFDAWSFEGKGKLGDGDISMGLSSNMSKEVQEIAKARKDLARVNFDHYTSSTVHSTWTSAHPMVQRMNLLNGLAHEISVDTSFEAIQVFGSKQLQWDYIRMSVDHRRSGLSQLLP